MKKSNIRELIKSYQMQITIENRDYIVLPKKIIEAILESK